MLRTKGFVLPLNLFSSPYMSRFAWENLIDRYDAVLDDLIRHF